MNNIKIPQEALRAGVSGDYYDHESDHYICVSFDGHTPVVVGKYNNHANVRAMCIVSTFVWSRHYGCLHGLMERDMQAPN